MHIGPTMGGRPPGWLRRRLTESVNLADTPKGLRKRGLSREDVEERTHVAWHELTVGQMASPSLEAPATASGQALEGGLSVAARLV